MSKQKQHDAVVDNLVERLYKSGRYKTVDTFIEYYNDNFDTIGEMDVVARTPSGDVHIYECKYKQSCWLERSAKKQLRRAASRAGFIEPLKLIYHTPEKTTRVSYDHLGRHLKNT